MTEKPKLYTYWRSSCSYRVRIVLHLKQIEFESIPIHLVKKEQNSPEYQLINPNETVPSLLTNGIVLNQSTAIIEYLEEVYPQVPLLPQDPVQRAQVRAICNLIGCDIQPIQNLRVLNYVGEKKSEWCVHFITIGFNALEKMLKRTSGVYSYGDQVTIADAFLVPQVYNALRWGVDMSLFPTIQSVYQRLIALEAFKKADPAVQPDAQ